MVSDECRARTGVSKVPEEDSHGRIQVQILRRWHGDAWKEWNSMLTLRCLGCARKRRGSDRCRCAELEHGGFLIRKGIIVLPGETRCPDGCLMVVKEMGDEKTGQPS